MKISIGRNVSGKNAIKVPQDYRFVSNNHATIYIDDDNFYIEDHSKAGTYVNGNMVHLKHLNTGDRVMLGSNTNGYCLNLEEVMNTYNREINENRTDYTKEFLKLKEVYDSYESELNKVTTKIQTKSFLPRAILTLIAIGFLLSPFASMISDGIRYPLMMGIGLLGGILSIRGNMGLKIAKAKEKLIVKYGRKYSCPKCRKKLGIQNKSWEMLKDDGECPYSNCNAIFHKM